MSEKKVLEKKSKIDIRHPPLRRFETKEALIKLEKKLGGKVLSYFVRSSWSMVQGDVKYFYANLKRIGHQKNYTLS